VQAYDTVAGRIIDFADPQFQGDGTSLDQGQVAWLRPFSGRGRQVILVGDLSTGVTTQLTNGPFDTRPPVRSAGTVVWALYNPDSSSLLGRGILVATAPTTPRVPTFVDLMPKQLYRTAAEWLGERGYATGYPGASGPEFRAERPLLRSQFCKLLVQVFGIPVADVPVHLIDFDSSDLGDPFTAQAMATLVQLGIVQGTADGRLAPYAPVTRAQAITLVVRALDHTHPGLLPAAPHGYPGPASSDPSHGANLTRAGFGGLLDGLGGYGIYRGDSLVPWDMWALADRGEAAQLLWSVAGISLEP
jgi:hypothetical protein